MEVLSLVVGVDFFVFATLLFFRNMMCVNEATDHELNVHVKRTMWVLLLLVFADTMDIVLGAEPVASPLRAWFVGMGFIVRPFMVAYAAMIFRQYQFSTKEKVIMLLPAMVNSVVILSALFHPYVFTISPDNVLHRNILSYFPHAISLYYLVYTIRLAVDRNSRGLVNEARIMFTALTVIIAAVISEIVFHQRGLLCGAIALTVSFYYVHRYMDSSRRDPLTGAFTRGSFFSDLSKMRPEQLTAFCEFDMNNLKEINDRKGHQEGDRAIVTVCETIRKCLPLQSTLYRFGGDEFAVLFYDVNMSTAYNTIYRIREEIGKTEYSCAIGVAEWKEGMTFREVYNTADEQMYEDKKQQKIKAGMSLQREE